MDTTEAEVSICTLPTCPWCNAPPRLVPWRGERAQTYILECSNDECAVQPSAAGPSVAAAAARWSTRRGQAPIRVTRKYVRQEQEARA